MKKILLVILSACVILGGCSKKQEAPDLQSQILTNKEIAKIYWELESSAAEAYDELGMIGVYGASNDEEEKVKHSREIYAEYAQKVLDEYGYKFGDKVKFAFVANGDVGEANDGCKYCSVQDETGEYLDFPIYFKDDSIVGIENKTVVVEASFTAEYAGSVRWIDECSVVEK